MFARIEVELQSLSGAWVKVIFKVDTGFEGDISLPAAYMGRFGSTGDTIPVEYANGEWEDVPLGMCMIRWLQRTRNATVTYLRGNEPLLGMELLNNTITTLEISNGVGEITIEPNE